ncbi:LruC domain-containing protein [Schleiferiaceae bacterium]|nr:LruC domain-containing protein [Schleiferiaceae bacterium]
MKNISLIIVGIVLSASCKKTETFIDPQIVDSVESTNEIVTPPGFDFSMTKTINVPLKVFGSPDHGKASIEIYELTQQGKENVYDKRFINPMTTEVLAIEVPSRLNSLLLRGTNGEGDELVGQFEFGSSDTVMLMPANTNQGYALSSYTAKTSSSGTNCNSGCSITTSVAPGGAISVGSGSVVCFTGNGGLNNAHITIGANAKLRICGSHTNVGHIQIAAGGELVLAQNASLVMASGSYLTIAQTAEIKIWADAVFSYEKDWKPENVSIDNYGTIDLAKKLELKSGSQLLNYGAVNVEEELKVKDAGSVLTNHGSITSDYKIKAEGGAIINNHCSMYANGKVEIKNGATVLNNYGYIKAEDKLYIKYDATLNTIDQSIVIADELDFKDGEINGQGTSRSMVKILGDAEYESGSQISGSVDICVFGDNKDANKINWSGSAAFNCSTDIPTTACIVNGNTPPIVDSDGDGVADNLDDFPNDADRAQSVVLAQSTLIAEDLWPSKGDYDFNDLVLLYEWNYVIDAQSNIKDMNFRSQVKARGAGLNNGFGFLLETDQANVESVTGGMYSQNITSFNANGTEQVASNSTTSSFIVVDNVTNCLSEWNTFLDVQTEAPQWYDFTIVFENAVDDAVLATFNPFVIKGDQRGIEIHLANQAPSALADAQYFNTDADVSNLANSVSYVTQNGMPWLLNVPANFDYVIEYTDLSQAYLKFANWAGSGGSSFQNWYDSENGENINPDKLISKKD